MGKPLRCVARNLKYETNPNSAAVPYATMAKSAIKCPNQNFNQQFYFKGGPY